MKRAQLTLILFVIGLALALVAIAGYVNRVDPRMSAMRTEDYDYDGHGFCGRVENIADKMRGIAPWPNKRIAWTVSRAGADVPVTDEQIRGAFRDAWAAWANVIDIEPEEVFSEREAHVRSKFGPVQGASGRPDGPGGILAWSELADGTQTPKHQLYDSAEQWGVFNGNARGKIDLLRVAVHEIGHVLGLVHDSADADAIMRPSYSGSIRLPRDRDKQRLIALGYRPAPPKPVDPPQPDPAAWIITIRGVGPAPKVEVKTQSTK
jgi:hypothetical protein